MWHILKQSHYVRCSALRLLCDRLCGPWTKKFGDPCFKQYFGVLSKSCQHFFSVLFFHSIQQQYGAIILPILNPFSVHSTRMWKVKSDLDCNTILHKYVKSNLQSLNHFLYLLLCMIFPLLLWYTMSNRWRHLTCIQFAFKVEFCRLSVQVLHHCQWYWQQNWFESCFIESVNITFLTSPLWPVSVALKNKLPTMSSNVQSLDFPMDCTAWWLWMMRQLNGCSSPAAKQ